MKRVVYVLSSAIALIVVTISASLAQSVSHSDRLSPSNLQRFSRDLIPSSAQDFFKAGQAQVEHEIRLLARPRSPLNEPLLTIRTVTKTQPEPKPERPISAPEKTLRP